MSTSGQTLEVYCPVWQSALSKVNNRALSDYTCSNLGAETLGALIGTLSALAGTLKALSLTLMALQLTLMALY